MTYTYHWPMAAPCSAILIFTRNGDELGLLTTQRHPSVGEGRSVSAGGYYEVKDMFNASARMQDGRAETYREMVEELGEGLKEILPYKDFSARVRHLWDGMVASADTGIVHNVTFRMLEVSVAEMDAIMALPQTEEQIGKMLETFRTDDDAEDSVRVELIRARLADFKYEEEIEAVRMWHEQMIRPAP